MENSGNEIENQNNQPKVLTIGAITDEFLYLQREGLLHVNTDTTGIFKQYLSRNGYDVSLGITFNIPEESIPVTFEHNPNYNSQSLIVLSTNQCLALLYFFGFNPITNSVETLIHTNFSPSNKKHILNISAYSLDEKGLPDNQVNLNIIRISNTFKTSPDLIGYSESLNYKGDFLISNINTSFNGLSL